MKMQRTANKQTHVGPIAFTWHMLLLLCMQQIVPQCTHNITSTRPQTTTQAYSDTIRLKILHSPTTVGSLRAFDASHASVKVVDSLLRHFCQTVTQSFCTAWRGKSLKVGSASVTGPGDGRPKGVQMQSLYQCWCNV